MKILAANQIYTADRITIENENISSLELMERAGDAVCKWLKDHLIQAKQTIHIFCGKGNNGGDGLVVGRLLSEAGYDANIHILEFSPTASDDFTDNLKRLMEIAENRVSYIKSEDDFPDIANRSEERRVGKECRSRWATDH